MKWWANWREGVIQLQHEQIHYLQSQLDKEKERVDRLTEAVASKANVQLSMPQPLAMPTEIVKTPNPWKDPNQVTGWYPQGEKRQ